jgi:hypothetical protein
MSEKMSALNNLENKRRNIMEFQFCLDWLEGGEEKPLSYDPTGDSGDINRAHMNHIENLRLMAHNLHVALLSIQGVFLSFQSEIPQQTHPWFDTFFKEFETFRSIVYEKRYNTRKNEELEYQISRIREVFTELFLKYFGIPQKNEDMTQDTENVDHDVIFNCEDLHHTFRVFAVWVRLDVEKLRNRCLEIQKLIDEKIVLEIAVECKAHSDYGIFLNLWVS